MHHSKASYWNQQRSLSRRDCISALAAAAVVPAFMRSTPAWAAEDPKFDAAKLSWRVLSRDDLGFSVDLPREPEISAGVNVDALPGYSFKYTSAEVRFDDVTFNVAVMAPTGRGPITAEEGPKLLDAMGEAIQTGTDPGTQGSFTRFTMNGCPGREDTVRDKADFRLTYRTVVCGGRVIQAAVMWGSRDDTDTAAERFLRSFRLLPGQR
jgi:hypothetical protein